MYIKNHILKESFEFQLDLDAIEECSPDIDPIPASPQNAYDDFEYDSDGQYSLYINRGQRKKQQDRFFANPYKGQYGVFDGHGESSLPVEFTSMEVFSQIEREMQKSQSLPYSTIVKKAFEQIDQSLNSVCTTEKDRNSGCVALLAQFSQECVQISSLGDSVAIIVKKDGSYRQLNRIHSAQNEIRMIEERGGWVLKMGNVYRAQGQLAVSRSLGNFNIKNVISNEPEVSEHAIEPDDVALVLGTDGLWNAVSFEQVAKTVSKRILESKNTSRKIFDTIPQNTKNLDNVTIMVIKL